jgi:hypothetical protein
MVSNVLVTVECVSLVAGKWVRLVVGCSKELVNTPSAGVYQGSCLACRSNVSGSFFRWSAVSIYLVWNCVQRRQNLQIHFICIVFDLLFHVGRGAVYCTYSLNKLIPAAVCGGGGLRSTVWAQFMEFLNAISCITNKLNCNWVAFYADWLKVSRWFAGRVIFCCNTYSKFCCLQYSVRVQVFFAHRCKSIVFFSLARRGTQRQNFLILWW